MAPGMMSELQLQPSSRLLLPLEVSRGAVWGLQGIWEGADPSSKLLFPPVSGKGCARCSPGTGPSAQHLGPWCHNAGVGQGTRGVCSNSRDLGIFVREPVGCN